MTQSDITLIETMNPDKMPRSDSHYIWLSGGRVVDLGWELDLSDGTSVIITAG